MKKEEVINYINGIKADESDISGMQIKLKELLYVSKEENVDFVVLSHEDAAKLIQILGWR